MARRWPSFEDLLGLLKVRVIKGVNLANRDVFSRSDPYVVIQMGKHKLKTRVVKNNLNPVWEENLILSISDPNLPIKVMVYDKDTITADDEMGVAELDVGPFLQALKMHLGDRPSGHIINKVQPNKWNCLAKESCILWKNGKVEQHMVLKLRNVECGEIELQLQWIDTPGAKGL